MHEQRFALADVPRRADRTIEGKRRLELLVGFRATINAAPDGARTARIFWATGVAAATSFAIGWALVVGNAIAHAYGGRGVVIPLTVTCLASELGFVSFSDPPRSCSVSRWSP
jgi:hypothetical protein